MLLVYMDYIVSWGVMPMMTRKFEEENNKNNKEDKKVEEKGGGLYWQGTSVKAEMKRKSYTRLVAGSLEEA